MKTERAKVNQTLIGLSDLAKTIADRNAKATGCRSMSEYIEWIILSQDYGPAEAEALLSLRKQRGGRGGVHVVPDDFVLPPEG